EELRLALIVARLGDRRRRAVARDLRRDVPRELEHGVEREVPQLEGAVLNRLDARLELLLRPLVAGLAGAIDVEHGAAHMVVADPLDEPRPRDAELHVAGVVAVDARDGMPYLLARLEIGQRVELLESLDQIAVAGAHVWDVHRAVAVQAGARLLGDLLARGEL